MFPPPQIEAVIAQWITTEESKEIFQQFQNSCIRNRQVLWSGLLRENAQRWADNHGFQTLTTALGPLLDPTHWERPHCKPQSGWFRYIHGASAVFAWYISQGELVTVLSQPPPQRFHPSGRTFYQELEEPIVKGHMGNKAVGKIVLVHPTVGGASDFTYEMWPHDEASLWTATFGLQTIVTLWRKVKGDVKEKHTKTINQIHPHLRATETAPSDQKKSQTKTIQSKRAEINFQEKKIAKKAQLRGRANRDKQERGNKEKQSRRRKKRKKKTKRKENMTKII